MAEVSRFFWSATLMWKSVTRSFLHETSLDRIELWGRHFCKSRPGQKSLMVKFSTEQKWYYYPEMTKDEVGSMNHLKTGWWWLEPWNFLTSHSVGNGIIPTWWTHIFQRGGSTGGGSTTENNWFFGAILISRARWCSSQWCLLVYIYRFIDIKILFLPQ